MARLILCLPRSGFFKVITSAFFFFLFFFVCVLFFVVEYNVIKSGKLLIESEYVTGILNQAP